MILKASKLKKGFTLIELIIVMTVMSILATAGMTFLSYTSDEDYVNTYVEDVQDRSMDLYSKAVMNKGLPSGTDYLKIVCNSGTEKNFFAYACTKSLPPNDLDPDNCKQIYFPTSNYSGLEYDSTEQKKGALNSCGYAISGNHYGPGPTSNGLNADGGDGQVAAFISTEFPYRVYLRSSNYDNFKTMDEANEAVDELFFRSISGTFKKKSILRIK